LSIFLMISSIGLVGMLQSFKPSPTPSPEPAYTTYKFIADHWWDPVDSIYRDYYAIKYSIYHIAHDGFGYYNEGPFYPNTSNNAASYETSQWNITYLTSTYATIWYKKVENDSWITAGDISMNTSWNTTLRSGTSLVYMFTIDMQFVPSPE